MLFYAKALCCISAALFAHSAHLIAIVIVVAIAIAFVFAFVIYQFFFFAFSKILLLLLLRYKWRCVCVCVCVCISCPCFFLLFELHSVHFNKFFLTVLAHFSFCFLRVYTCRLRQTTEKIQQRINGQKIQQKRDFILVFFLIFSF